MSGFLAATAVSFDGEVARANLDPEWFFWGPFGGYLAAIVVRAICLRSVHGVPATFSCHYLSVGESGPIEIAFEILKTARSAESIRATVYQKGRRLMEAVAWIVVEDLVGLKHSSKHKPDIDPPKSLPLFKALENSVEEHSPIWHHIERRPRNILTNSADCRAEWVCWLKLVEALPRPTAEVQAARAVLWMDLAPWNAALTAHAWPIGYIAPTLELSVSFQLFARPSSAVDWLLACVESNAENSGLVASSGELWTPEGQLVAVGTTQSLCRPVETTDSTS